MQVMLTYEAKLTKAGLMDFDDMLSNTLSLLEVPSVGAYVGRQFEHVLVDEFQVRFSYPWEVGSVSSDSVLQECYSSVVRRSFSLCTSVCKLLRFCCNAGHTMTSALVVKQCELAGLCFSGVFCFQDLGCGCWCLVCSSVQIGTTWTSECIH